MLIGCVRIYLLIDDYFIYDIISLIPYKYTTKSSFPWLIVNVSSKHFDFTC